jgi:hypothetical protein
MLWAATAAFAVPPGLFDPAYDGDVGGGILVSMNPIDGRVQLGFELYYLSSSRFGGGITVFVSIPKFALESFSLDALYYYDFDSSGRGFAVVPLKLRLGIFGERSELGAGFAAGIEYYAVPMFFDSTDNIILTGDPNLSGFFTTVKAVAELDYSAGTLTPWIVGGTTLIGTVGGSGAGGYTYYYYY